MFPKAGNAFAQQKELERQKRLREAPKANLGAQSTAPSTNNGDALSANIRDVPDTPQTTFDMFLARSSTSLDDHPVSRSNSLDHPQKPMHVETSHQRSVTDPTNSIGQPHLSALPEPLFKEKESSSPLTKLVSNLNSKSKGIAPSPAPPTLSGKALQILGGETIGKSTPKSSLELSKDRSKSRPDPYRISSGSEGSEIATSLTTHPVAPRPTKRWLIENQKAAQPPRDVSADLKDRFDTTSQEQEVSSCDTKNPEITVGDNPEAHSPHSKNTEGIILGNSSLSPTRHGTYGTVNTVQLVDQRRIPSTSGSIVQPSPRDSRRPSPLALRSPSPVSATNPPYGQPSHVNRRFHQTPPNAARPAFYGQMPPPSYYNGHPSPGPWVRMQQHHPATMPVFTPNAPKFRADPNSMKSSHPSLNNPHAQLVYAGPDYPTIQPAANHSDDLESTPKGPSTATEAASNMDNSLGNAHHPQGEYTPYDANSGSSDYSEPSLKVPYELVEQLISREFAALRSNLQEELDRIHHRIDNISQAGQAFTGATTTLKVLTASINALSLGVQADVRHLRDENSLIRQYLEQEFDTTQREMKNFDEALHFQIEKSISTLIEQHLRPLIAKLQQISSSNLSTNASGDNDLLDRPVNAPKGSPSNPLIPTFRNVNVSALGGAWLRQAESMEARGGR